MHLRVSRLGHWLWTIAIGACLAGCSAPRPGNPGAGTPASAPNDFALIVTVLGSSKALTQARYIVEPDGVLRAARGSGVSLDTFPVRTRELQPAQIDHLYTAAVRSGLRDTGRAPAPGSTTETTEGPLIIIETVAHDTRRVRVHEAQSSREALTLVRTLEALARIR